MTTAVTRKVTAATEKRKPAVSAHRSILTNERADGIHKRLVGNHVIAGTINCPRKVVFNPAGVKNCPRKVVFYPAEVKNCPRKVVFHPAGVKNCPRKVVSHPQGVKSYPPRVNVHPAEVKNYPPGEDLHPAVPSGPKPMTDNDFAFRAGWSPGAEGPTGAHAPRDRFDFVSRIALTFEPVRTSTICSDG